MIKAESIMNPITVSLWKGGRQQHLAILAINEFVDRRVYEIQTIKLRTYVPRYEGLENTLLLIFCMISPQ